MADKNKIASELTPRDLEEFIDECWQTAGLTLSKIQELAAARGLQISLMSAKSFRDTTFQRHLDRLRKAQDLSLQVAAMQDTGAGHTLADAGAAILAQEVFDMLIDPEREDDLESKEALSRIIKRIRDGDAKVRLLELKVRDFERLEAEREEKRKQLAAQIEGAKRPGGLTADTLKRIEEAAKLL